MTIFSTLVVEVKKCSNMFIGERIVLAFVYVKDSIIADTH